MANALKAIVEGRMLSWAREFSKTTIEEAAKASVVSTEKIIAWENGSEKPTVRQLRLLAKKFRFPLALFYLPDPPDFHIPKVRDFRSIEGIESHIDEYKLTVEIRNAFEKREILVEYQEAENELDNLALDVSPEENSASLATRIRNAIGLTVEAQVQWRDNRTAFNELRDLIESKGALILQTSEIDLSVMRGFSLDIFPIPVIVVNRKDAYAGRSFTLIHELSHVLLRTSAICNYNIKESGDNDQWRTEVFCNSVAAQTLVPEDDFKKQNVVVNHKGNTWDDGEVAELARRYNASREVIVRRLLELGLTNRTFYEKKRNEFKDEYEKWHDKKSGFVPPAVNVSSLLGRKYIATMLSALDQGKITLNDFSDYVGMKLKHLDELRIIA